MLDFPFLVCRPDGRLDLVPPPSSGLSDRTLADSARWPAWNPQGDSVAYSTVQPAAGGVETLIASVALDGSARGTLQRSSPGAPPFIAPGVPHYALWSPDGEVLSYVAPTTAGLGLFLSRTDQGFVGRQLATSAPVFSCWTSTNTLMVHTANALGAFDAEGISLPRVVEREATGFRTPAISPDGEVLLFAEASSPMVNLLALRKDAADVEELGEFLGTLALSFRPGRAAEASVVVARGTSGVYFEFLLIDLAGRRGARRRLFTGPFVAAIWAPDGERVAIVVPAQTGDGRYAVMVLDDRGRTVAMTEAFLPSADLRLYFSFFDQYTLSHHLWSPDGRYLVLAGRLAPDGVSASLGDPSDYVFLWEVGRSSRLQVVGQGTFADFPPPAPRGLGRV